MTSQSEFVDLTFGLSQLSGNRALYLTLLERFSDEYRDIDDKVQQMMRDDDIQAAFTLLHTLKGVTANLGLPALNAQSKHVEAAVRETRQLPGNYPEFIAALESTLQAIETIRHEDTTNDSASSSADSNKARATLTRTLEAMEFIAPETLRALLDDISIPAAARLELEKAIVELDYQEALRILNAQ